MWNRCWKPACFQNIDINSQLPSVSHLISAPCETTHYLIKNDLFSPLNVSVQPVFPPGYRKTTFLAKTFKSKRHKCVIKTECCVCLKQTTGCQQQSTLHTLTLCRSANKRSCTAWTVQLPGKQFQAALSRKLFFFFVFFNKKSSSLAV